MFKTISCIFFNGLFFITSFDISAQFIIEKKDSVFATIPADKNGIHYRVLKNSWEKVNLKSGEKEIFSTPGIGSLIEKYDLILNKDTLYLVSILGGEVIEVTESKIKRIDKSFNHRMQNYSIIFSKSDTIFRHGGYGFWSARNMITYFDKRTKAWELYPALMPQKHDPIPAIYAHQYILSGDSLLIFGGWKIDADAPLYPIHNNDIWFFSFSKKQWSFLGKNNWLNNSYVRMQRRVLENEGDFYLIDFSPLIQVSISKNQIQSGQFSDKILYWINERQISPFKFDGKIYFYRSNTADREKHEFCSILESELTATLSEPEDWIIPVDTKNTNLVWIIFSIIGLCIPVIWLTFRNVKIKNKKSLSLNNPDSDRKGIELDLVEFRLVELFLASYPEHLIISQIDAVLETSNKSKDVQNQRRSQVIRLINLKFMARIGTKESVIQSKRSEQDGRMMNYYLNPQLEPAIRQLV